MTMIKSIGFGFPLLVGGIKLVVMTSFILNPYGNDILKTDGLTIQEAVSASSTTFILDTSSSSREDDPSSSSSSNHHPSSPQKDIQQLAAVAILLVQFEACFALCAAVSEIVSALFVPFEYRFPVYAGTATVNLLETFILYRLHFDIFPVAIPAGQTTWDVLAPLKVMSPIFATISLILMVASFRERSRILQKAAEVSKKKD